MKENWIQKLEGKQEEKRENELKDQLERLFNEYEQRYSLTLPRKIELLSQIVEIYACFKREGFDFDSVDCEKKQIALQESLAKEQLLRRKQQKEAFTPEAKSWKAYQIEEMKKEDGEER